MGHPAPCSDEEAARDEVAQVLRWMRATALIFAGAAGWFAFQNIGVMVVLLLFSVILGYLAHRGPINPEDHVPREWWVDPKSSLMTAIQKSYAEGEIGPLEFEWKVGQVIELAIDTYGGPRQGDEIWAPITMDERDWEFGEDGKLRAKVQKQAPVYRPRHYGRTKTDNWLAQQKLLHQKLLATSKVPQHYLGYQKQKDRQTMYDFAAAAPNPEQLGFALTKLVTVKVDHVVSARTLANPPDVINGDFYWTVIVRLADGSTVYGYVFENPTAADLRTLVTGMNKQVHRLAAERKKRAMAALPGTSNHWAGDMVDADGWEGAG